MNHSLLVTAGTVAVRPLRPEHAHDGPDQRRCRPLKGGSAGSNPVGATPADLARRAGQPSPGRSVEWDVDRAALRCRMPAPAPSTRAHRAASVGELPRQRLRRGRPTDGPARYLRETAKTYEAARLALTRLQGQVDEDRHPKIDITLGRAIEQWLEVASTGRSPGRRGPSPSGTGRLARKLGLRSTRLHALRHYSATELIAAGADIRTVAGRLGHGSGGATTLKIYAAWVDEAGQRAATTHGRNHAPADRHLA
jgi:Phage integrase family